MADSYLLVPMQLDAMVLYPDLAPATPFLRFQLDYTQLQNFQQVETPFAGGSTVPPGAGIYLHWTLPVALRHGIHQADGTTDFPLIPNRWLVARTQAEVAPSQAVKAWIIISDSLSDYSSPGTSNYIDPSPPTDAASAQQRTGSPGLKGIGQALLFDSTVTSLPPTAAPFLKAVGPGNVRFSSFEPGVQNVLAFIDDMTDSSGNPISSGMFTYQAIGWYSNPSWDPLQKAQWTANPDPKLPGTYLNRAFDWLVYVDSATSIPSLMLVHALVSGVSWDSTAEYQPPSYPSDIPTTVQVAVGNTAIDAMAALVSLNRNNPAEGALLEAFQYHSLDLLDQPGSSEALDIAIRKHWYGATTGGTTWRIVPAERTGNTALPAPPAPATTGPQATALAALNAAQAEMDQERRILQSMQWNLFSLWWKNQWQNQNDPPLDSQYQTWLLTQLPLQLGDGSACNDPGGTDPSPESWYYCKVQAQINRVHQLAQQVETQKAAVVKLLQPGIQKLKAMNLPQYFHPNDPVVLIAGLGRSTNFDPAGSVVCRLTTQAISQLSVNGTTYSTSSSNGTDIQSQIPVLDDPNSLLPDGVQELNTEGLFLSPALFAQDILGDMNQAQAVLTAIQALPGPPSAVQFPPASFAIPTWAQPWIPLILDWQVTVLKEPAYTAPTVQTETNQPTCTFNQANWQFDGTQYNWIEPTKSTGDDFSEGDSLQMQLQGRTFITPYLAFTLADQLDQYVKKHSLRDPNLEALLKDLDQYIDQIEGLDILSQRLSGMTAQMIQRYYSQTATPWGSVTDVLGDSRHGYPMPDLDENPITAPAVWDFAPWPGPSSSSRRSRSSTASVERST